MGARLEEDYKGIHRPLEEEVHRSREGVQVAVDNSQEHLGVAGIVKEGLAYPKEAQGVRRMTRMGGQAAARKGWEAQGVRRMMRMGDQAAVRKGWEDLEVVHSCQQIDLDNHYYGDVQDSCLLILAVEIQSLWVPGNRAKETMVRQET